MNISPINLRDYAKTLGWNLLTGAVEDGLYVLSHPDYSKRQLVFPINSDAPDYENAVEISLNKLSELSKQSLPSIISGINELRDDTIRFRIVDSRNDNNFIPLSYAITAINGTKEIFLAAASSVLKPQAHHTRLSRVEAWQLLDASRFRHTETGSFVIKISSPINALEVQGNLFEENIPFARQRL